MAGTSESAKKAARSRGKEGLKQTDKKGGKASKGGNRPQGQNKGY